jgi:hypothetical protein
MLSWAVAEHRFSRGFISGREFISSLIAYIYFVARRDLPATIKRKCHSEESRRVGTTKNPGIVEAKYGDSSLRSE